MFRRMYKIFFNYKTLCYSFIKKKKKRNFKNIKFSSILAEVFIF